MVLIFGNKTARMILGCLIDLSETPYPLLHIPATGGVAAKIQRTADKVDDLHRHLTNTGEAVDTGDLSNAVLKAVRKYMKE